MSGKRFVAGIDAGKGFSWVELACGQRTPKALRQARLGVVIYQEDVPAELGECPRKVMAGRSLADSALLVQHGDADT